MRLNTKITVTILQAALIPWVLAGGIAYLSTQEYISAKTYTDLNAFANLRAHWLQDAIQNRIDALNLLLNDPELIALFSSYTEQLTPGAQKKVHDYLRGELGVITSIQKVFMMMSDGTVAVSTDGSLIGTNVGTEDYFKLGLRANDVSTLKKNRDGSLSQYLVGPIKVRGETKGVIVVVSDAREIISIAEEYSGLGNTGETVLAKSVNSTSALFLTPTRFDHSAALTRIVQADQMDTPVGHAVKGEESIFTNSVDYRGVKVFAATRYISSIGWGLIVKIDQSEALSPVKKLGELLSLVIMVSGLFMMFIGISISRSITKPINALASFADSVAHGGSLQETILITSKDEVGLLGQAFNRMIEKLQEAYKTLEDKVIERTFLLSKKTVEAEDSQKAALNIAADLRNEEEKLKNEKIKAENLAADLKKFKWALDDASDQVTIMDPEGIVVYANKAVERITGYSPEDTVGKKAGVVWNSPMPTDFYQNLWYTTKDQKRAFVGEIQNRRKNGEIYIAQISLSPVLDEEGRVIFFVGIERDITKEKEADKAKNEFISLASHQMRTPLTAINWYTEMLLGGDAGVLNTKQEAYFREIYSASNKINKIIKSFLRILRIEAGVQKKNLASTDLVAVAQSILSELKLESDNRNIHVTENYDASIPRVMTDADLIRIIMHNFVSNAIKYSRGGGEVEVALKSVPMGDVVTGKTVERDSVLVSVRDSGIGIPEYSKEKIFTKFFRADNAQKSDPNGNGLGLYMSRMMAELIGSVIWFDSKEGEGTTFYALVPVGDEKAGIMKT